MYQLVDEPKGGTLAEAFNVLDDAFGTGEFSENQGVSALALGMEVDDSRASELLRNLVARECVEEV